MSNFIYLFIYLLIYFCCLFLNFFSRKISMKNVELNERLAADGGSGASVYVCTVDDSWQCVVKELNLAGLGADLIAKFESESFFFFLILYSLNFFFFLNSCWEYQ